jgi:hypothetical protein
MRRALKTCWADIRAEFHSFRGQGDCAWLPDGRGMLVALPIEPARLLSPTVCIAAAIVLGIVLPWSFAL